MFEDEWFVLGVVIFEVGFVYVCEFCVVVDYGIVLVWFMVISVGDFFEWMCVWKCEFVVFV